MKINNVTLVYFSPTNTTKAVVESVARGMGAQSVDAVDITRPDARKDGLSVQDTDLVVVGVPVYMGRVPGLLEEWFAAFQVAGCPVVCVVVYGNRVYDDALLELKNFVTNAGGVAVAGGAFIGEHSFSSEELPVAHGRPDSNDVDGAEAFGQKVKEKLESYASLSGMDELSVPGEVPYRGETALWDVDFIAVNSECTECGVCTELCPTGAIDPQNSAQVDVVKCILCCSCIKNCPYGCRSMKDGLVKDASVRLNTLFHEPRQPEWFL
ncbi:MAG: flavodoxin domain-containing protein [Desulfovibrio sp.]